MSGLKKYEKKIHGGLKWILKKSPVKKKKLHIYSSSRHEKRCRMLQRIFWLFQCSRNQRFIPLNSMLQCSPILQRNQAIAIEHTAGFKDRIG